MRWLTTFRNLFRRSQLDQELDEEIAFHLEMREKEYTEQGMSVEQARHAARRRFGNGTLVKEDTRQTWGLRRFDELRQDLVFGFRSFRKNPGFTATLLVTLALGVGVGTAIFSVINAVLLQPPPYENADRLVMVWDVNESRGIDVEFQRRTADSMGPAEFRDWQDKSGVFDKMVGFSAFITALSDLEPPEEFFIYRTSPGLFDLIGTQPMLGRGFSPEDEKEGGEKVLILFHDFWRQHFASDPNAIGKTVRLRDEPYTVIGVMPPGFNFYNRQADALAPMPWTDRLLRFSRNYRNWKVMAQLKPGTDLSETQAQADVFAANLARDYPESSEGWGVRLVPVTEDSAGSLFLAMQALLGAIGCVLLITCTNVANLLMVKASGRSKEIAVRSAIGAGRRRLIRQMLTESLCLSAVGGALGLGIAFFLVEQFRTMLPYRHTWAKYVVQAESIAVDGWVVGFAFAVTVATGLLFGLLPALGASKTDLNESLKDVGQGSVGGRKHRRTRDVLVVCEVALAVVMVIGATLLVRSSLALYRQGPGFRADNTLSISVRVPTQDLREQMEGEGLEQDQAAQKFNFALRSRQSHVFEAVKALPGVESVAAVSRVPLNGFYVVVDHTIQNHLPATPSDIPRAVVARVTTNYFSQFGIPLLQGRTFESRDSPDTPRVVVINRELKRRYFRGENPIGRRIRWGAPDSEWEAPWETIVGVVGDVHVAGMQEPPIPALYRSIEQMPRPVWALLVRTPNDPLAWLPDVRKTIAAAVPGTVVSRPQTVAKIVADSAYQLNYSMLMMTGLAVLALVLAVVGLYGVLSQTVRERTKEIGLRMALGAARRDILAEVVGHGVSRVALGVGFGLIGSAVLGRFLSNLLFGIGPNDALTFVGVAAALLLTAVVAAYIPARRAAGVDPMIILRHE